MSKIPEIYPEGVKVLIQVDDTEKVTKGGIIVPPSMIKSEQKKLTTGTVKRIGPDAVARFLVGGEKRALETGDRIIFSLWGGFSVKDPEGMDRDFRLLNDEDVLALVQ